MNLTKANIRELKKVTVKIVCSNHNEGSGTIVSVGENIYVLTAAHVVENETHDGHFSKDQIVITFMRNSKKIYLSVDAVNYYNREDDAAILHVENPGIIPITGLDKVRLLTTDVSGSAELCGFHKSEDTPKHYTFENRGKEGWAIVDIQLGVQSLEPARNFEGVSGGGIFYQDTNKVLYMAAYMSGVGRHDGNNNEFVCKPSSNFISSGLLNSIVDDRCYEFVADSAVAFDIDSRQMLNSLDRSGYELNQTGFFIENDISVR